MTNFREFAAELSPSWLRRFFGERFVGVTEGLGADLIAEGEAQALRAPWLKESTSPNDALPSIGDERGIFRTPPETDAEYRERLFDAWDLWSEAATVLFAQNALAPFGIPAANITLVPNYFWNADPGSTHWSRWWLVITDPPNWDVATWGGPVYGNWGTGGYTWGSSATQEDIFSILKILRKWKSAHEIGVDVILAWDTNIWGLFNWGTGTWANGVVKWPIGHFWGPKYAFKSWGSPAPYNIAGLDSWGGIIKV
jgi:hypothetical protein